MDKYQKYPTIHVIENTRSGWRRDIDKSVCHRNDYAHYTGRFCRSDINHNDCLQDTDFHSGFLFQSGAFNNPIFNQLREKAADIIIHNIKYINVIPHRLDILTEKVRKSDGKMDNGEMRKYVTNNLGEIEININFMHMSVMYLCCYNKYEYKQIREAMDTFYWIPFDITFDGFICVEVDGKSKYIHLYLDHASQDKLERWAQLFDSHLINNYATQTRKEEIPFHITMAGFNYNMNDKEIENILEIVEILNKEIKFNGVAVQFDKKYLCWNGNKQHQIKYDCPSYHV